MKELFRTRGGSWPWFQRTFHNKNWIWFYLEYTNRKKKATGIDDIPPKILKNLDKLTKSLLFNIYSNCYKTGKLPNDFIKSKSITILKKGNATNCTNYKTVTLLLDASKILLNVIKNKLKVKIEEQQGEDQFRFRIDRETRDAILALRLILERRLDVISQHI